MPSVKLAMASSVAFFIKLNVNGDMNRAEVEDHTIHVLGLHLVRNTSVYQEKKSSSHSCKTQMQLPSSKHCE